MKIFATRCTTNVNSASDKLITSVVDISGKFTANVIDKVLYINASSKFAGSVNKTTGK
jgi:hypothetical protein